MQQPPYQPDGQPSNPANDQPTYPANGQPSYPPYQSPYQQAPRAGSYPTPTSPPGYYPPPSQPVNNSVPPPPGYHPPQPPAGYYARPQPGYYPPQPAPAYYPAPGQPAYGVPSQSVYFQNVSFTGKAVVAFLLYFLGYIPGLIFNILFLNEAHRVGNETGKAPAGVGWVQSKNGCTLLRSGRRIALSGV